MARVKFALRMALARFDPSRASCPYCSSYKYVFVQRKKVLIEARRCESCGLMYRWPTDSIKASRSFYEGPYNGQQVTDMPDIILIDKLLKEDFKNSAWDKAHRLEFIHRLVKPKGTLLDFGCSWGYGAYQYRASGFRVKGFELDKKRAEFGRLHLGLNLYSNWEELKDVYFDVIMADHTLEHLPNLDETLEEFQKHSRSHTKLVIFVPNCACKIARDLGVKWGPFIGETHTMAFTIEWFSKNLPRHNFYPQFFTKLGEPLTEEKDSPDMEEIALMAVRDRP